MELKTHKGDSMEQAIEVEETREDEDIINEIIAVLNDGKEKYSGFKTVPYIAKKVRCSKADVSDFLWRLVEQDQAYVFEFDNGKIWAFSMKY